MNETFFVMYKDIPSEDAIITKKRFIVLSKSKNITPNIFEKYSDLDWDHYSLANNPNFRCEYIMNNPLLKIHDFSSNINVTFQFVLAHPELEWTAEMLIKNPGITFDDVVNNFTSWRDKDKFRFIDCASEFAKNPGINFRDFTNYELFLKENHGIELFYSDCQEFFEFNHNLTWEEVTSESSTIEPENMAYLHSLTPEIYENYPQKSDISVIDLFRNKNFTWQVIKKFKIREESCLSVLFDNPSLTFDDAMDAVNFYKISIMEKGCDRMFMSAYYYLCENPRFTLEQVIQIMKAMKNNFSEELEFMIKRQYIYNSFWWYNFFEDHYARLKAAPLRLAIYKNELLTNKLILKTNEDCNCIECQIRVLKEKKN